MTARLTLLAFAAGLACGPSVVGVAHHPERLRADPGVPLVIHFRARREPEPRPGAPEPRPAPGPSTRPELREPERPTVRIPRAEGAPLRVDRDPRGLWADAGPAPRRLPAA